MPRKNGMHNSECKNNLRYDKHPIERHIVVASLLLVASVACDCATALEIHNGNADVAASLRISSIVALLMLASPPVVDVGLYVTTQRCVLGVVLVFLALCGERSGSLRTRVGDAVFCTLVLVPSVLVYSKGGIETSEVRPDCVESTPHRRQTINALCGALFLYVGLRGVRSAYSAPQTAVGDISCHVGNSALDETSSMCYAHIHTYISSNIVSPLAFGHGVMLATGLLILVHEKVHDAGSHAVAFEVGWCGVVAFIAATWNLMGVSELLDELSVLYGRTACSGDYEICAEAYKARRFAISNASSSGLWLSSLAALLFSFPKYTRKDDQSESPQERHWRHRAFTFSVPLTAALLFVLLLYSSSYGAWWRTDVCVVVAVVAVFISYTTSTTLGTVLYVASHAYEEVGIVMETSTERVFVHLTHCTIFLSLILLTVHSVAALAKTFTRACCLNARLTLYINECLGVLATLGLSLSVILYIASSAMMASSNGSLPEDRNTMRDGSGKMTMIAFFMNHFIPVFAWIPLYFCRSEPRLLPVALRRVVWLMALPLMSCFYAIVLGVMNTWPPSMFIIDILPFSVIFAVGALAWVYFVLV